MEGTTARYVEEDISEFSGVLSNVNIFESVVPGPHVYVITLGGTNSLKVLIGLCLFLYVFAVLLYN